jgi:hypothetical protein
MARKVTEIPMTKNEVHKVVDLIASILMENPSIVPGQDGMTIANWLHTLYFDEKAGVLMFGRGETSRGETELILLLRKQNIPPEEAIRLLQG